MTTTHAIDNVLLVKAKKEAIDICSNGLYILDHSTQGSDHFIPGPCQLLATADVVAGSEELAGQCVRKHRIRRNRFMDYSANPPFDATPQFTAQASFQSLLHHFNIPQAEWPMWVVLRKVIQ